MVANVYFILEREKEYGTLLNQNRKHIYNVVTSSAPWHQLAEEALRYSQGEDHERTVPKEAKLCEYKTLLVDVLTIEKATFH